MRYQVCVCWIFVFISSFMIKETLTELENCLNRSTSNGNGRLPNFQDYGGGDRRITLHQQAIIPSYEFTCCGVITEWGVDVERGGGGESGDYTIDFQVWRPSPTTPQDDTPSFTGYYSLVGNNRFSAIPLSGGVARLTPSPPQVYIQFRPGDVLGFYVEETRDSRPDDGVVVLTDEDFPREVVWYSTIEPDVLENISAISAGIYGNLSELLRGAPVISINILTSGCPSTTASEITTMSPTQTITVTGSGVDMPTTSNTVGLTVGLIITSITSVISLTLLMVIVVIIIFKKKAGFLTPAKHGAIDNFTYELQDVDNSETIDHHGTPLYHSTGPLSGSKSGPMKSKPSGSVGRIQQDYTVLYEDPTATHASKGSSDYESHSQDVFDMAGFPVPTIDERAAWEENHYELEETQAYSKLDFFVQEQIYWAPASTTSDLYSQLSSKKYREIPRSQLTILEALGSGEFGAVSKALWTISGASRELAVKTLRPGLPEEEKVRFLQEAAIMGQFSHPNVVKLYGVVTLGEPVMICIELLSNGDLRGYLCSMIPENLNSREMEKQFLKFSKQIASGMNYLSKKSFVHRDLAARNVLLDSSLICKIGDFGMARDLMEETYYTPKTKGGKIPVKWTAPEALNYKKYSTDSDVWSYGMVLFEIWSVGKKPFSQFTNKEVARLITSNYNQPPLPGCPRAIYKLMVDCWHPDHKKRPKFSDICDYLKAPTERLLQWAERDERTCPDGRKLGAPLSTANNLYQDIQNIYK